MRRLFLDSNVPIYAIGGASPYKEASVSVLAAAARGEVELHANVEMVQEFLFHRMRRCSQTKALTQAKILSRAVVLHDFDAEVLRASFDMVEHYGMRGRDAVHAATAVMCGIPEIVTSDRDFESCHEVQRVAPEEFLKG